MVAGKVTQYGCAEWGTFFSAFFVVRALMYVYNFSIERVEAVTHALAFDCGDRS
jgi:hypothetical protein